MFHDTNSRSAQAKGSSASFLCQVHILGQMNRDNISGFRLLLLFPRENTHTFNKTPKPYYFELKFSHLLLKNGTRRKCGKQRVCLSAQLILRGYELRPIGRREKKINKNPQSDFRKTTTTNRKSPRTRERPGQSQFWGQPGCGNCLGLVLSPNSHELRTCSSTPCTLCLC